MYAAVLTYMFPLRCRDTDSPICGLVAVLTALLLWAYLMFLWVAIISPWALYGYDAFGGILAASILVVLGVIVVGVWPPTRGQET